MSKIVKYTGPKTTKDKDGNPVGLQSGWDRFCALYIKDKENRDESIAGLQLLHDLAFSESDFHTVFSRQYPNPLEKRLKEAASFNSGLTDEEQDGFRPINAAIVTGIMKKWVARRTAFQAKIEAAKTGGKQPSEKELHKEAELDKILNGTVHALIEKIVVRNASKAFGELCANMSQRHAKYDLPNAQPEDFHLAAYIIAQGCIENYDPRVQENFVAYLLPSLERVKNKIYRESRATFRKNPIISLNEIYSNDNKNDDELGNALPDEREAAPDDSLIQSDNRRIVDAQLSILSSQERKIVELRMGLNENFQHKFKEIGTIFGITTTQAKGWYNRAITILRRKNREAIQETNTGGKLPPESAVSTHTADPGQNLPGVSEATQAVIAKIFAEKSASPGAQVQKAPQELSDQNKGLSEADRDRIRGKVKAWVDSLGYGKYESERSAKEALAHWADIRGQELSVIAELLGQQRRSFDSRSEPLTDAIYRRVEVAVDDMKERVQKGEKKLRRPRSSQSKF